jgi:hypothetical protein
MTRGLWRLKIECHCLNMKYPPQAYVLNAWSLAGGTFWEVRATWRKEVTEDVPLKVIGGPQSLSLCFLSVMIQMTSSSTHSFYHGPELMEPRTID